MSLAIVSVPEDKRSRAIEIVEEHGCSIVGVVSKSGDISKIHDPGLRVLAKLMEKTIESGMVFIAYFCENDADSDTIAEELEKLVDQG